MWTAATTSPATRKTFIGAIASWLENTTTDLALTDLYDTIEDGGYPVDEVDSSHEIKFIARPVAGGHFSLLALEKARKRRLQSHDV